MKKEEARAFLLSVADKIGTTGIEYLTDKDEAKMREAIDALEKADKYEWHDLRKNPDDLPKTDAYKSPLREFSNQILVRFKDGTYDVATCYKYISEDKKFFIFGMMDDETDCYGVCDNTGDDIVKWKYIDEPEGE